MADLPPRSGGGGLFQMLTAKLGYRQQARPVGSDRLGPRLLVASATRVRDVHSTKTRATVANVVA